MEEMKDQLRQILNDHGKYYLTYFKKDQQLILSLIELYGDLPLKELFYCGLNDYTKTYCKYNNKKKFKNLTDGYKLSCVNHSLKDCKCYKEKRTEQLQRTIHAPENKILLHEKRKQTNLKKYGAEHYSQTDEYKEKIKQTSLKKHGVEHYSQTDEYKEKIKQTNLERHGVEHASQNSIIKQKIVDTNLERYGVKNASQNKTIKEKKKQAALKKYGVDNPFQSDIVKEKIKQTNLKKYNVEHYMQLDECKEKMKQTMLEKYGVENPQQCKDIQYKTKQTNLDRYGVENPQQSEELQEKTTRTNLERYGVENPSQNTTIKQKMVNTNLERYGVEYPSQNAAIKQKMVNTNLERYGVKNPWLNDDIRQVMKINAYRKFYNNIIERVKNLYTPLFDIDEYIGAKRDIKYCWECNKCKTQFEDHIGDGRIPRCYNCNPINTSLWEIEVREYVEQFLDIEQNNRSIIKPLELDIYIPSKNIAIECNGSYWHSEINGLNSVYHLNKTELCEEQNIQLLHIWEHEWQDNKELVKSIIKAKLGLNNRIYARKTQIQVVDNKTKELFLNENHLQANCVSKYNIGLYYENELVALMAFDKSHFDDEYEWELIRYCSKQNINVIGGASKLFKYFIKNYNPNSVISYADRRYSNGNMYKQLGFEFDHNSNPNYKYTQNYRSFINGFEIQKHKLEEKLDVFDKDLTSWENMVMNGYDRIWDCGNSIWVYRINTNIINIIGEIK